MPEMRTGRTLSQTPGLCTLYLVTPGDDRMADECIGIVATPELAEMIVASVNGELPQVAECQRRADERLADLQREIDRRTEARARTAEAKLAEIRLIAEHLGPAAASRPEVRRANEGLTHAHIAQALLEILDRP